MRTFRIFAALVMAVVCVSLSSCSKDDENEDKPVIEQANLIGKWQSTWWKIHTIENNKEVIIADEAHTNSSWEFKADGTCTQDGDNYVYKWSLKDKELTIVDEAKGFTDIYIVEELTANKLVLSFEDWDNTDDGGLELDDITTTTYKKITK